MTYGSEAPRGPDGCGGGGGQVACPDWQAGLYQPATPVYPPAQQATACLPKLTKCGVNIHCFTCKHERFCDCSKVERVGWDQQMDEGL
jgi:hypothetical protein